DPDDATVVQLRTQAGMVMGTAAYMSPEQALGKEVDTRTDIFSLGAVLYEVLTRRQPFTGETINNTIVSILEAEPVRLSALGLRVPRELEDITFRALAKDPDDRYPSAAELMAELKALLKRLEFEAELERSSTPEADTTAATQMLGAKTSGRLETGNTIAVLPFLNLSRNEDGDYFSDGLAEELLNVLSKIRGLRVAARTSAFSFKGKQITV